MKISSIISVRNVLRMSGIVGTCVGVPIAVLPGLAGQFFFGKRTTPSDKAAQKMAMRVLGVSPSSYGIQSATADVSKAALAKFKALLFEDLMCIFHWTGRVSGQLKKAEAPMNVNLFFGIASATIVAIQAAALRIRSEMSRVSGILRHLKRRHSELQPGCAGAENQSLYSLVWLQGHVADIVCYSDGVCCAMRTV